MRTHIQKDALLTLTMIDRRQFICVIAANIIANPLVVCAQQAKKKP